MIPVLIFLQVITLLLLALLWLASRRPAGAMPDARLESLLAADLPGQMARLGARSEATESYLRAEMAQLRAESAAEATRSREAAAQAAVALRTELLGTVNTLGRTITTGLDGFRADNKAGSDALRAAVDLQLNTLAQRLSAFAADQQQAQASAREALHASLKELGAAQQQQQDKLRDTVEQRLDKLNADNTAKLDQMRETVDEKLHATLQTRLTESFGVVTDQLANVHKGLGEMNTLSAGVSDLNRLFSNVKSRGGYAEVQLERLLEQVLAPGQFLKNVRVKPGSLEVVEFAIRFPSATGEEVLLPIDSKFPRESWDRLETAYDSGDPAAIEAGRRALETVIRGEGKRISSKYICEPETTPYAIMFLPTEGLYAEMLRRDGLQAELHQQHRILVTGPSNLYALLTSFQMGFRILNLQKKGNEVWKVLANAQSEFGKFETLMDKMDKQVGTVQNTIRDLGVRTRAINRTLRDVSSEATQEAIGAPAQAGFDGLLPMLAASEAAGEDE